MEWGVNLSVCRKSFAFSQTVCLFQMEKRASPLFQAFFPLQHVFFLNQAAVFRQSHVGAFSRPRFLFEPAQALFFSAA